MTLDEASERLAKDRKDHHSFSTDLLGQAEQLGVEAIKEVKWLRECQAWNAHEVLPGETED